MKKLIIFISILMLSLTLNAQTITSVAQGGLWSDTLTWSPQKIPTSSDSVIIDSNVKVLGWHNCKTLTINANAVLEDYTLAYPYSGQITVHGDLLNNGIIQNTSHLNIILIGNVQNNGTFKNKTLQFGASGNQTMGGQNIFGVENITKSPNGTIVATSNLMIDSTSAFDLILDTLQMSNYKLTALSKSGRTINGGLIRSNVEIDVSGPFGCNVEGNITFSGTKAMQVENTYYTGGTKYATGNIKVAAGKIVEVPNYYGYEWQITGKLINEGTIRNNPEGNKLNLYINGEIINNGIMSQNILEFDGTNVSKIGGSQKYSCNTISKLPNGTVYATNHLVIDSVSAFDLNLDTLQMSNYKLTALSKPGKTINSGLILSNGEIDVTGPFSCNVEGDNITFSGIGAMQIEKSGYTGGTKYATGNIKISAGKTVEVPNYYGYEWQITGKLINEGTIRNNPEGNKLNLYINGEIINNGIMSQNVLEFDGTNVSKIGGSQKYSCNTISKLPNGTLYATNHLMIDSTSTFDLNLDTLQMSNYKLTAFSVGNKLFRDGLIKSNGEIDITGPFGSNLDGDITFSGLGAVKIEKSGYTGGTKYSYGNLTLSSTKTLQTIDNYSYGLHIFGSLTNHGNITNGKNSNLNITLGGDLNNDGTISSVPLTFNGTAPQTIKLIDNKPINTKIYFVSNIGGSGFKWYKNGILISGATSNSLAFDSLSSLHFGTYKCFSSTDSSRIFEVKGEFTTSIYENNLNSVSNIKLLQSYPNPFSYSTTIKFQLIESDLVKLAIYDLTGNEIEVIIDDYLVPNIYEINWHANRFETGVYLCSLRSGNYSLTKKLFLLRE